MVKFILIFLVFVGLIILGPFLSNNQGFVHIEAFGYIVEMSVISLIICVSIFLMIVWVLEYLFKKIFRIKNKFSNYLISSKLRELNKAIFEGLNYFVFEEFSDTLKSLDKQNKETKKDIYANLLSYYSAVNLSDVNIALNALNNLEQIGVADNILQVLRIRMYLYVHDYQSAFNIVSAIRTTEKKHTKIFSKFYYQSLVGLGRFDLIEKNSQEFLNNGVMRTEDYNKYVVDPIINQISNLKDIFVIEKLYNSLAKSLKENILIKLTYADELYKAEEKSKALNIVLDLFKNNLDHSLIYQGLSQWKSSDLKIIEFLEKQRIKLLSTNEVDLDLNIALAHLYVGEGRLKEANDLYINLLQKFPSKELYARYGYCQFIGSVK
jgi:HemY protein